MRSGYGRFTALSWTPPMSAMGRVLSLVTDESCLSSSQPRQRRQPARHRSFNSANATGGFGREPDLSLGQQNARFGSKTVGSHIQKALNSLSSINQFQHQILDTLSLVVNTSRSSKSGQRCPEWVVNAIGIRNMRGAAAVLDNFLSEAGSPRPAT